LWRNSVKFHESLQETAKFVPFNREKRIAKRRKHRYTK
jgi:hypothetical protein